ncbi:MAG: HU family DNA-binding protein [Acidobacteriota bacterium]|jgi:integration host factor subunit beta|uniref:Integration host factor subunit beta n=1 Tax=Thermoanaerobaculum aquaticum TaxID=1312852 RepID=A0A7V1ZI13_9BACT
MTRAEIVEALANHLQLPQKAASEAVNVVLEAMVQALRRGEEIELRGFGCFRFRQRKPRTGRNPRTGEKVAVAAKKVVYFKPGKELKEQLG